jgi:hypothetical protein
MSNFAICIGNIKPKQIIKLYTIFIQMISTQDMSYEYSLMEKYPSFHDRNNRYNNIKDKK